MKNRIRWSAKALPVVLPILFVLYFLGYLKPCYNVALFAKNIVGEGNVAVNLSAPNSFVYYYDTKSDFNDRQVGVAVRKVHYDVSALDFNFASVAEMDLQHYEVRWLGIPVARNEFKDILPPGEHGRVTASLASDGESIHIVANEPEAEFSLKLKINYVSSWLWIAYWAGLLLLTLLFSYALGFAFERYPNGRFPLASLAGIVAVLLSGCFFCGSFPYVDYTCFLLNVVLLYGVSLLLGAFTWPLLGSLVTMGITLVFYIVNYYTILFRGRPVMPADLSAVGTAAEVLGGYVFKISWQMAVAVAICILYAVGITLLWKSQKVPKDTKPSVNAIILKRIISAAIGIILLVISLNNPIFRTLESFAWDSAVLKGFHQDGMWLTFIKYARLSGVKEPDGYDREAVNGYLREYQEEKEASAKGIQPTNIIMVMNEAFSDLRTMGLDERIDVMPFIDSLQENTVKGRLYVSVFGGGTCNTEFEALTGNSLAFFGPGAYPYSQDVNHALFSLAEYFKSNGYVTTAFHANEAQNWNRDRVYPFLGFETFHSLDDYTLTDDDILHDHPADIADYQFIEREAESNSNSPRFSFVVTIQNHSGYENWEDVKEADSVATYGNDLSRELKVYLSLIKASDDAVRQLVETYQNSEEPTMIVFFGDHQPGISYTSGSELFNSVMSLQDFFQSKFFIWTNYETEADPEMTISANYLPWLILKRGNFPLPPYVRMLEEVHEKYPILTSVGIFDSEGNIYRSVQELMDDPIIRKYQYVQYANIFDKIDPAWFTINQDK